MNIFKESLTIPKIIRAFLPSFAWALIIYLFSSQSVLPGFEQSAFDFFLKKIAHIFVYLILYLLVAYGIEKTVKNTYTKTVLYAPVFICILYAVTDEIHQTFVPGRYGTLRDIGYDMLGVSIAFLKKHHYI